MRFSDISWTKDAKGFFYSRYPEPPKGKVLEAALSGHALYYHRVGTPQSEDVLVYERKDLPGWIINGGVSEDGRYLLRLDVRGRRQQQPALLSPISATAKSPNVKAPVKPVIEADDAEYLPIGNQGSDRVSAIRQGRAEPQGDRRRPAQSRRRRPGRRSCPSSRRRSKRSP